MMTEKQWFILMLICVAILIIVGFVAGIEVVDLLRS